MNGYIYKITNDINDKVYIGKTLQSIEKRFNEHLKDSDRRRYEKRPLYNAMNKYGISHFSVSLVEEVPIEQLNEREIYWIQQYLAKINSDNNKCDRLKKAIIAQSPSGDIIEIFQSRKDAAQWLQKNNYTQCSDIDSIIAAIGRVANGHRKSAYHLYWKNL